MINGSQEYREAAEDWEGDVEFFLEAEPDRGVPQDLVAWLDLWHGECRGARMITAVSGTLVHLVAGAAFFLLAVQLPHGLAKAFAATSALLQLQAFVVALYPFCFIEMDGYHAVVDWLGLPTLKHDAVQFVRRRMVARLRDHKSFTREERIWIWYFALSFVSVAGFALFTVWSIAHIFVA